MYGQPLVERNKSNTYIHTYMDDIENVIELLINQLTCQSRSRP